MKYLMVIVVLFFTMSVMGAEFVCDVKGSHYGNWQEGKMTLDSLHQPYKIRFNNNTPPKLGSFDEERKVWDWDKLTVIKSKNEKIYYGVATHGGFLSAVFDDKNNKLIVNFITAEGFLMSNTEYADCTKL